MFGRRKSSLRQTSGAEAVGTIYVPLEDGVAASVTVARHLMERSGCSQVLDVGATRACMPQLSPEERDRFLTGLRAVLVDMGFTDSPGAPSAAEADPTIIR